jgi:hypothetical protein
MVDGMVDVFFHDTVPTRRVVDLHPLNVLRKGVRWGRISERLGSLAGLQGPRG